jgi:hypothetical protein
MPDTQSTSIHVTQLALQRKPPSQSGCVSWPQVDLALHFAGDLLLFGGACNGNLS